MLQIEYSNEKVKSLCTSVKVANKLFGGNAAYTKSLMARINAIQNADTLRDIIVQKSFRFHNLHGDMEGLFAIDVKTKADPWRIILQPLDENKMPYNPCNIDEISGIVRIVEVMEVSKHYE